MKNLLFLSFFIVCFTSTIQAQFSLGLDGGMNYNHIDSDQTDAQFNYYFGVRPTFILTSKFNVGVGIQYSVKGYEVGSEPELPFSLANRNNYLDFLPQIEYRPIGMLGMVAGMNLGYPLSVQTKIDNKEWSESFKIGAKNSLERFDVGILIGLRLYVKNFYLSTHYNHGLKDDNFIQFTDANGNPLNPLKRNRTWQVGLGYLVDL